MDQSLPLPNQKTVRRQALNFHTPVGLPASPSGRGAPPSDVDALAEALVRVSVYAAANAGTLESIDLNPVLVRAKGEGCVAVDALIVARAE